MSSLDLGSWLKQPASHTEYPVLVETCGRERGCFARPWGGVWRLGLCCHLGAAVLWDGPDWRVCEVLSREWGTFCDTCVDPSGACMASAEPQRQQGHVTGLLRGGLELRLALGASSEALRPSRKTCTWAL